MKMRLCLSFLVIGLMVSCTEHKETSTAAVQVNETPAPVIAEANRKVSECDPALNAIPKYREEAKMYFEIYEFYKKYNKCMDAGIAEGMESLVTQVLDKKWNDLHELNSLIEQEPAFKKFILLNIDSLVTGLNKEVNEIVVKSEKHCPKGLKTLCGEINKQAKQALKSESEDGK